MKKSSNFTQWFSAVAAGGLLALASQGWAQIQPDYVINRFNDTNSVSNPWHWWGGISAWDFAWDSAQDAGGGPAGSGALHLTYTFDNTLSDNQIAIGHTFKHGGAYDFGIVVDCSLYQSLEMDLKVDTNNTPGGVPSGTVPFIDQMNHTGDPRGLGLGLVTTSYGQIWFPEVDIDTNKMGVWQHLSFPINRSAPNISAVAGLVYKKWEPNGTTNLTGQFAAWIDNLVLKGAPITPKITMALEKPIVGLNLFQGSAGQYDREGIATQAPDGPYGWVNKPGTTKYAITIASLPPPNYGGFQTHMFIAPGASLTENDPDWNEANIIFVDVDVNTNGSATMNFRFKTNEPAANSFMFTQNTNAYPLFNGGSLTNVSDNSPLGTWSVEFQGNTAVTLRSPSGNIATCALPPDVPTNIFADPVTVFLGSQANNLANLGQKSVLSSFAITTNGTTALSDNFVADPYLDTNVLWTIAAVVPAGVLVVPSTSAWWVNWNTPDGGAVLQANTSVVNKPGWYHPTNAFGTIQLGNIKRSLFANSELPPGPEAFFRAFVQVASKLQILLPGETADPTQPNGKTGTPDPQSVGVPFNIIVNAVDNNWNIVAGATDTVHLTTTDATATVSSDTALTAGTHTFTDFQFNSTNTFTITVSDVSNTNVASSVSAPVTAN
jgi:hypothetical protein